MFKKIELRLYVLNGACEKHIYSCVKKARIHAQHYCLTRNDIEHYEIWDMSNSTNTLKVFSTM